MLASHYHQKVVRLKQKLADLSQKVARESEKAGRISRGIVQVQRNITHTSSPTILLNRRRRATSLQQELAKTQKTLANLEEQAARTTDQFYRAERQLARQRQAPATSPIVQPIFSPVVTNLASEVGAKPSRLVAIPVPTGAGWKDVSIRFTSDFQIQATIRGQPTEARNYADLGFEDQRGKKGKNRKPDFQWRLLKHFVRNGGSVETHLEAGFKSRNALQKGVRKLRQRLKKVFGLDDDPIEYDADEKSYRAKFQGTTSISTDVAAESQRRTEF